MKILNFSPDTLDFHAIKETLLYKRLDEFLSTQSIPTKGLYLSFSGGEDSTVLFCCLYVFCNEKKIPLKLIHIDHGLRSGSGEEALLVKNLAERFKCPFFLKRLSKQECRKNIEAWAREERRAFYKEVYQKEGELPLLLAHHAKDQAEEVMRRLLEKHPLLSLKGMQKESYQEGFCIWRPWLDVDKKEIDNFLKTNGILSIQDPTNFGDANLRARYRTHLFPAIKNITGKDLVEVLCDFSRKIEQQQAYLEEKTKDFYAQIEKLPLAILWSVPKDIHLEEFRFTIKKWLHYREGIFINDEQIENIFFKLKKGHLQFIHNNRSLYVDRGVLFVFNEKLEKIPLFNTPFDEKEPAYGPFKVYFSQNTEKTGWKAFLRGEVSTEVVLNEPLFWSPYKPGLKISEHVSLNKWLNNAKVPKCVAERAPFLINQKGFVKAEFLTGKKIYSCLNKEEVRKLTFFIR